MNKIIQKDRTKHIDFVVVYMIKNIDDDTYEFNKANDYSNKKDNCDIEI